MAWPVPNVGQWNSALAMGPDPSGVNIGSLTPEQWAIMQQQNWQQWTQWQQQYAQWQSQYGDKYAEQVQAIQAMGMPPPPTMNNVSPPVPPPPEKPPPPPPHENDQPLYGNSQSNISAQYNTKGSDNNFNMNTGNNQNRSYDTDAWSETKSSQAASAVNNEALKKLAEEERLFDIQFQKWEEEIQKWKLENVNHPDKQAYSEYEQKFEACRAQLLERRQQMKLRRAKLMNNTQQPANTNYSGNNNILSPIPPTVQTTNLSKPNTNNISPSHQISKPAQNYYPKNTHYQHYNSMQNQDFNRNNNKTQDRFESYDDNNENYVNNESVNSSFLPISSSSKGIPGLDLVPDLDKGNRQDVIDISEDKNHTNIPAKTAPDYSTISQGINSILGDEKIMNILSMVQNQKPAIQNSQNVNTPHIPPTNQWNKSGSYNKQYDNRPGTGLDMNQPGSSFGNRHPPGLSFDTRPPSESSFENRPPQEGFNNRHSADLNNRPPQGVCYDNRQATIQHDDRNPGNLYDNRLQNNFDNRQNVSFNNQSENNFPINQGPIRSDNYPEPSHNRYDPNCEEDNFRYCDQSVDPNRGSYNNQYSNSNMHPRGALPIRSHGAPNKQINLIPGSQNTNNPRGFNMPLPETIHAPMILPPKPKWVEEPLFTPSIIVEYEHKPLRLKARDFIEPVHTFDYNHKSKDSDVKKRDFEREVDELFARKTKPYEMDDDEDRLYGRDTYSKDYERRKREEDFSGVRTHRNDYYHEEKSRHLDRYNDRRDDRDVRYSRRDENYTERDRDYDVGRDLRERERDYGRDREFLRSRDRELGRERDTIRDRDFGRERDVGRDRDISRDRDAARERDRDYGREREAWRDRRELGNSRDRDRDRQGFNRDIDNRKRGPSLDSEVSNDPSYKKAKDIDDKQPRHVVMIDDLLEPPGRETRPDKILIILRGIPGSGKSYLAKLIRDREAEHGGTVRIMSIDDYFMQEGEIEETDPATGKSVKKPLLKYEYDENLEESYISSLKRALKRSITDGYFSFIVFDAVNDQLKSYADVWNFARQNCFQVYICTLEADLQTCYKRNIHNRKLDELEVIAARFYTTPPHHIHLDPTTLLQNAAITEVQMEDADVPMEDAQETEVENSFTSKWERMDDVNQLARLDGTSKPLRPKLSMEDYLQLDDWTPNKVQPGKKTVRWADIEERREQEKMRAIGFVVGQTDWNRMTDPTLGSSALTQTKYIERVRRN